MHFICIREYSIYIRLHRITGEGASIAVSARSGRMIGAKGSSHIRDVCSVCKRVCHQHNSRIMCKYISDSMDLIYMR